VDICNHYSFVNAHTAHKPSFRLEYSKQYHFSVHDSKVRIWKYNIVSTLVISCPIAYPRLCHRPLQTGACRIRVIDIDSQAATTLAGSCRDALINGAGTHASFLRPRGVALDQPPRPAVSTLLFVADSGYHCIRQVVLATGDVTTLAGSGTAAFADGAGALAAFNTPSAVAADAAGNLYVADTLNHRVRKIVISTRLVSTVAGSSSGACLSQSPTQNSGEACRSCV
jgi:hypothetical protein